MHRTWLPLTTGVLIAWTATTAPAQNDISWLTLTEDSSRIPSGPLVGSDTMEKDYAWDDLDRDGDIDVVIARKIGWTNQGPAPNVLLMNEGGNLVDRTALFASASDVPGDQGFLTSTNDRDVEIADVDGDGWMDVITSPAITNGLPKHLSHPRIYMNLGNDGGGNWLGLEYQDARIPDLGLEPFFCGVGAGDVTGDGAPDLYFVHYLSGGATSQDDRLMINDGAGNFTDQSLTRMTADMLTGGFGTSAYITDMNGDGFNDVLRNFSGPAKIAYNDPNNEGFFNIQQDAYFGAAYHVNYGDLNLDNRPDIILSDDGDDRYLLNQGNDPLGRVIWSAPHVFNLDGGFAGNNIIVDLNNDGWDEALITDVDVDIPGCFGRMFIYHNRGGEPGGFVTMFEESDATDTGATGITAADMGGSHDVAVFDIDNDGDKDLLLGRCDTTHLWLNETGSDPTSSYCGPAVPNSTGTGAKMGWAGSLDPSEDHFFLTASDLPPNQFGFFLVSATQGSSFPAAISQGKLCLGGQIGRFVGQVVNSGTGGTFAIQVDTTGLPAPVSVPIASGSTWNFVAWFRDENPNTTSNFTDGIEVPFN